jgi:putative peptidoglycan lipid II flippase
MSGSLERIGLVSASTILSRLLGLLRDMLTTAVFGASILNSAFITAFTLPNLFRRLLGEGALTAAFIPVFSEELEERGRTGAFDLLSQVVTRLFLVTGGLTSLAMVGAWWVGRLPGLTEKWYVAAQLSAILFPYLVFICLAAAFAAALNALNRFVIPALTAVWLNLSILIGLGGIGLVMTDDPARRIYWLCAGVLMGGLLQCLIPGFCLWREGWRPAWRLRRSSRVSEILRLMGPGLIGASIFQINILTSRALAYALNDSAATLLYLANRQIEVPLGVFTIAIATVVFPELSRYAARGDHSAMQQAFRRGMILTLALAIPASVGIIMLREPIIRLLFERGAFLPADTRAILPILVVFGLGLPFYSFVTLLTRAFHAFKDTATPVRMAAIGFGLNLVLSITLMRVLGTLGLAVASNTAIVVQTVLLQVMMSRHRAGFGFLPLVPVVLRQIVAAGAMAIILWFSWRFLQLQLSPMSAALVAVLGLIPVGAVVYGGVLWLIGPDERRVLRASWERLRQGRRMSDPDGRENETDRTS